MSVDVSAAPVGAVPVGATGRPVAPSPPGAVARDLCRLTGVLAEPITPVRRAALVAHIGFLADQVRDDLDGAAAVALSRLRHEARRWGRDPGRRTAVFDATVRAAAVMSAAGGPLGRAGGSATPPAVRLAGLLTARSPAVAYRFFWLIDDLSPDAAASVTGGFSRPARWALRNLLSGGYNRRAHLMWVGGGSGPAV